MPSVTLMHHEAKELIYLIQSLSSVFTLLQNVTTVTSLFVVSQLLPGRQQSVIRHIPISEALRCENPIFKSLKCSKIKGKSVLTDISKETLQEEGMRQHIDFAHEVCAISCFYFFFSVMLTHRAGRQSRADGLMFPRSLAAHPELRTQILIATQG